MTRHII